MIKDNVKLEIEKSLKKITRIEKALAEISEKESKLQIQRRNLEKSLSDEEEIVKALGLKQPRRDDIIETPESLDKKRIYNEKLQNEKKEFIESSSEFKGLNPIEKLKQMSQQK